MEGNGGAWWACSKSPNLAPPPCSGFSRPQLIRPTHVTGFTLSNLTLRDSPSWTVHLANVTGAVLSNFSVFAPYDEGNTDGCDIDASRNISIADMVYAGGDDAVAIKSGLGWLGRTYGAPTEDVTVSRLHITSGNGYAIGSEMSGGVRRVLFQNVTVDCTGQGAHPCKHGLYIKTARGRGGLIENITVEGGSIKGVGFGYGVTLEYTRPLPPPTNASATPRVSGLVINGGVVEAAGVAFEFQGLPESVVSGVVLEGVSVGAGVRPFGPCENATGVCKGMAASDCPPCFRKAEY